MSVKNSLIHSQHRSNLPWLALCLALLGHGAAIDAMMLLEIDVPEHPPALILTASLIREPTHTKTPAAKPAPPTSKLQPLTPEPRKHPPAPKTQETPPQPTKTAQKPEPVKSTVPTKPKQVPASNPARERSQSVERRLNTPTETTSDNTPPAPIKPQPAPVARKQAPIVAPRFHADYLSNPAPAYPKQSRYLGEEGKVLLKVQVSESGDALEVMLHESSGFNRLDRAALEAVRQWKFIPARQGRDLVTAWVVIPLEFSLRRTL